MLWKHSPDLQLFSRNKLIKPLAVRICWCWNPVFSSLITAAIVLTASRSLVFVLTRNDSKFYVRIFILPLFCGQETSSAPDLFGGVSDEVDSRVALLANSWHCVWLLSALVASASCLNLSLVHFGKGIVDTGHCPTSSRLSWNDKEVCVLLCGYQR